MRELKGSGSAGISARRVGTHRLLKVALALMVVWAFLPTFFGHRVIVINTSPSVAPGLYLRCAIVPAVGRIVDFRVPSRAKSYVQDRTGKGCEDWYILKPIVAGPGDQVDTTGASLVINGRTIASMPPDLDGAGRLLPIWRENRVLGPDEFFVFSKRISNSFDSRCYGPITRSHIESVRMALLTW